MRATCWLGNDVGSHPPTARPVRGQLLLLELWAELDGVDAFAVVAVVATVVVAVVVGVVVAVVA